MTRTVFTIGHSNHQVERFAKLLEQHGVTALCDVRSKPYSRFNPQFNRESLKRTLYQYGIVYVFLGLELGARTGDGSCYEHGKVKYERLAQTELFRAGLNRIQRGSLSYQIAIMCSEKDPLECHRTILVARHLEPLGFQVQHILADGQTESQAQALTRLMRLHNLSSDDMFSPRSTIEAEAYRRQEERIAYSKDAALHEDRGSVAK